MLATGDVLGAEYGEDADTPPIMLAKPFSLDDVRVALDRLTRRES